MKFFVARSGEASNVEQPRARGGILREAGYRLSLFASRDRLQRERWGKRLPPLRCVEACHAVSIVPNNDEPIDVAALRRLIHDLRGPLNAMRLSLDLLRRTLARKDAGGGAFRDAQLKQIERLDRQITAATELLARAIEVLPVHDEAETT